MTRMRQIPSRQRGAALVIGLVLLLILTLLAVTGMNTSSLEMVMAGNEQFRQKSFQAAETGLEEALTRLADVGQSCEPQDIVANDDDPDSQYAVTAQYEGDGSPPSGFTLDEYTSIHYQVVSKGKSARNTNSENTQGALIVQSKSTNGVSFGCNAAVPTT